MTLKVGDLKTFDDNVNILLGGGEVFSLKIVSTDRDTLFLEAYMEETEAPKREKKREVKPEHKYIVISNTKKREFPHVEENALILGDYDSRDLINDLYGWFKKWIKK